MKAPKTKLSGLLNQAMLAIMGILFCFLAIKQGMQDGESVMMMLIGMVLIVMGIVRYCFIRHLLQKVEAMDETTMALFEQSSDINEHMGADEHEE